MRTRGLRKTEYTDGVNCYSSNCYKQMAAHCIIPNFMHKFRFWIMCFVILWIFIPCLLVKNVYAEDVIYTTKDGNWVKVNDSTYTMDKDGDGITDVTLVQEGNEWKYIFTVADDKASYYAWEEEVPDGYEVIGRGTRANPVINSSEKYSHTPNISDDGIKNGNYTNSYTKTDVVSIPGADKLHVVLTYGGEGANYDWVSIWEGSFPNYTAASNYNSGISVNGTKKFGGGNGTTVEFDINGDSVTFAFRSDGSGVGNGYGYYAVITGSGGGLTITNKSKENPAPESGAIKLSKKVTGKGTVTMYSHTSNISDDGVQNGSYTNNLNTNEVISIPNASQLHVVLTYGGESANYDWVCAWPGNHPDYSAYNNYGTGISVNGTKKFGGGNGTTVEFDVEGDSVTFAFRSDGSGVGNGYGYYAVVTGNTANPNETKQYFKFNVQLSSYNTDIAKLLKDDRMYGDISFKDGEGLIYLANGDDVILDDIPAGVNYTITEEPNEDYSVSWAGGGGTEKENVYSGTVEANTTHEITCINTYTKLPSGSGSSTEHPVECGNLKLSKHFVNAMDTKTASFHIAFWGLDKDTTYKYSSNDSGYEFTSDSTGLADAEITINDNQEISFSDLPDGCKYQISEDASEYIASYEISGASNIVQQRGENFDINKSLTTAKETIKKNDDIIVTFTNTGKEIQKSEDTISINVKKIWDDNDDAARMRPDNITVQLTQDDDVIATAVLENDNDWSTSFTDMDKYQEDGKTEYNYAVNEIEVPGYQSKIVGSKEDGGNILFTITNTLIDVGNLKVSKTVEGDGVQSTQEFRFEATFLKDGKPLQGIFNLDDTKGTKTGSIAFDENGKASFTLKHGESIFIKDIPANTKWSIKEDVSIGYTEVNNGEYSGTIVINETSKANVINTHNPSYKISVSNIVKGNQGSKTKDFHYQMKLTGNGIPSRISYSKNEKKGTLSVKNGMTEFTLTHEEEIVFAEIPAGIEYTITETDGESNGYNVQDKNTRGIVDSDIEVSFINTKNVGVPTAAMTNTMIMFGVMITAGIGILYTKKRRKK